MSTGEAAGVEATGGTTEMVLDANGVPDVGALYLNLVAECSSSDCSELLALKVCFGDRVGQLQKLHGDSSEDEQQVARMELRGMKVAMAELTRRVVEIRGSTNNGGAGEP